MERTKDMQHITEVQTVTKRTKSATLHKNSKQEWRKWLSMCGQLRQVTKSQQLKCKQKTTSQTNWKND